MRDRMGWAALIVVAAMALAALGGGSSAAQGGWPTVSFTPLLSGLNRSSHLTNAADGTNRLFLVEQAGYIRIIQGGALLPTPFLDIDARVSCCGERGLLSVAFPPDYASKQHFYVYYTDNSGSIQLSRFRVTGANPNVADASSEQKLLTIPHPGQTNHNGGQLAFGPDGYLYMFTGDGGGGGDPYENSQNIEALLGKALRLDVESNPGSASYQIPPTNPFVGVPGRDELWAYGLRNPWRASFDRATGELYIADVGQNAWEEVDVQPAASAGGENYGWDCYEGNHPYELVGCSTTPSDYVWPVTEYSHAGGNCSITGGYVYRGSSYPALTGIYFYTDYCTPTLRALRRAGPAWESTTLGNIPAGNPVSFGEDEAGDLYVLTQGSGGASTIYRIVGPSVTPTATVTSSPTLTPGPTVTPSPTATASPTVTTSPSQLKLYLPMVHR